jgi:hypothetical protein
MPLIALFVGRQCLDQSVSPGCRSDFSRPAGQSYVGGNDPGGAATAGSEWTSSGVGWGVLRSSRRRKYPPITPASTMTSAGGSRTPVT